MATAKTPAQVIVDYTTGELEPSSKLTFAKIRKMRRDPTIALCRRFGPAPILASTWSVEGDDEDQTFFLESQFLALRTPFLRTALLGEFDFGWKPYELVFDLADFEFPDGRVEKLNVIKKVKPLRNDDTKARYDKDTGDFLGFSHTSQYTGEQIFIDAEHSLFVNFDDEGLGNYAEGTMHVVEAVYDAWNDANDGAARYDKKMAGMFLVVYYPVGETKFKGTVTDNATIAEEIIKAIKSSGAVSIPVDVQDLVSDLQKHSSGWKIEFLDPQAKQSSFVDRQKYLDALKARAAGLPERSILEGEFGTKAEAGIHASAALLTIHLKHENITELMNAGPVNRLLTANWGKPDTAWLKAMPLTDEKAAVFKEVLLAMMADVAAGPDIADKIDAEALVNAVGLPVRTAEQGDELQPTAATVPIDPAQQATPRSVSIQVA